MAGDLLPARCWLRIDSGGNLQIAAAIVVAAAAVSATNNFIIIIMFTICGAGMRGALVCAEA